MAARAGDAGRIIALMMKVSARPKTTNIEVNLGFMVDLEYRYRFDAHRSSVSTGCCQRVMWVSPAATALLLILRGLGRAITARSLFAGIVYLCIGAYNAQNPLMYFQSEEQSLIVSLEDYQWTMARLL